MAHYRFLDENDIVLEVITGRDEDDLDNLPDGFESWEEYYLTKRPEASDCKRTSYNTRSNLHIYDGTPFRGNFAMVGGKYYRELDVFMDVQPYPSWTMNEVTCEWDCPVAPPEDIQTVIYKWNEDGQSWDIVPDPGE